MSAKPKAKAKFYELTKQQKEAGIVQDIYRRINQQDRAMDDLLSKYMGKEGTEMNKPEIEERNDRSRTLDVRSQRNSMFSQRSGHGAQSRLSRLELPYITKGVNSARLSDKKGDNRNSKVKVKEKIVNANDNLQLTNDKKYAQKQRLKQALQQAYLGNRAQINYFNYKQEIVNNQSSRFQKNRQKSINRSRIASGRLKQPIFKEQPQQFYEAHLNEKGASKEQGRISVPLALDLRYFAKRQSSQESSEQGDVPLNYYQKEYRAMIRAQCLEQTNFLYFSKNQSMQNWTEGLLLLFQKHDKELSSLRKRCKYLQSFDNNFFSIDIFKND